MGNQPSVEALTEGRRATNRLSKPRIGNPAPAGLSISHDSGEASRRHSIVRRTSMPDGLLATASSSTESPSPASAEPSPPEEAANGRPLERRLSRALFRSKSSHEAVKRGDRKSIFNILEPQPPLPGRTTSITLGVEEAFHYTQGMLSTGMDSSTAVHYDFTSYEAKRLLHIVDDRSQRDSSVMSESQFQVSEATWKNSNPPGMVLPGGNPVIPRVESDVALYTPMRRRSTLLTPGIATRAPRAASAPPKKPRVRHSLPTTPMRRDSLEFMGPGLLTLPSIDPDPSSIPRAVTPSDMEYRQIGAFKLGTLRIVNGSPVSSPVVEKAAPDPEARLKRGQNGPDYFPPTEGLAISIDRATRDNRRSGFVETSPGLLSPRWELQSSPRFFEDSEMEYVQSPTRLPPPIPLSPIGASSVSSERSGLQTTSKHTALEDELFDEEPQDYIPEVLDIRVDLHAKSLPPRPKLISEGRKERHDDPSDSGIETSPDSEYAPKALSKADSGYSSNMSLRSFSAKPEMPEKESTRVTEVEVPPDTPPKDYIMIAQGTPTTPALKLTFDPSTSGDDAPPPVPEKDFLPLSPKSPRFSKITWPKHQDSEAAVSVAHSRGSESPSALAATRKQASGGLEPPLSPLSPTDSTGSASAVSIGSGSRKVGKLQRLLSGVRMPLTVHTIHPSGDNPIPPVSEEAATKLREHSGSATRSFRISAWLEPDPDTSKKNSEAVKPEAPVDDKISSAQNTSSGTDHGAKPDEDTQAKKLLGIQIVSSTVSQAASSTMAIIKPIAKPIVRKPVPVRKPVSQSTSTGKSNPEPVEKTSKVQTAPVGAVGTASGQVVQDSTVLAAEPEHETHFPSSSVTIPRPMTAQPEQLRASRSHISPLGPWSPNLPSHRESKNPPPPVSMRASRYSGSYNVSAPRRPKSTPPAPVRIMKPPSRRASRENVQSYPGAYEPLPSMNGPLGRKPSRETVHSYPPAHQHQYVDLASALDQPPPIPIMNPRRSIVFRTASGEHRVPNWEVETDHDISRRSSIDRGRGGTSRSHFTQENSTTMMIPQPEPRALEPKKQRLRHYSSYDGYSSSLPEDTSYAENGPYPPMHDAQGRSLVTDPWSGRPIPQQLRGCAPYVPRGHQRHRSLESKENPAPYRILHSYNSPAYRHVPIWG